MTFLEVAAANMVSLTITGLLLIIEASILVGTDHRPWASIPSADFRSTSSFHHQLCFPWRRHVESRMDEYPLSL